MPDSEPQLARFLDLTTRCLVADPQARDEARDELLVRVVSAEEAGDAAEQLKGRKPGRTWIHATVAFAALIILAAVAGLFSYGTVKEMLPLAHLTEGTLSLDEVDISPESERDFVSAQLAENLSIRRQNLERLVHERPLDRGLYEEYAGLCLQESFKLPPNYHETWRRIDPGNGAWLLRESMMKSNNAFKGSGGSGPVTDEKAFIEALDLMRQAAAAEHFEIHDTDLRRRRLALLPEAGGLADETRGMLLAISTQDLSRSRLQQFCGAVIREEAGRLAAKNDPEGLRELIAVWRNLSLRLSDSSATLLDSVTALGFTFHGKEPLLKAAIQLGMKEEQELLDAVDELNPLASSVLRASPQRKSMAWLSGGAGLASPPPEIASQPARFEAGRRVEYAVADRLFALTAALLCLLLLAIAGIEGIRRGKVPNALADGLAPLFRPVDTMWVLTLGLMAPVAYYWLITRLTPLGCRDLGAIYYSTPPAALQALAGLLLTWACMQTVVRWRVAKRTSFLAAPRGTPVLDLGTALLLAALIPAIGGVRWLTKNEDHYLKAMAAACGLPFLGLVWQAGTTLLASRSAALPGILSARKLVMPLTLLTTILLGAVPVLRMTEQHWLQQDTLGRAARNGWGMTLSEELSVRWITEGLEKTLGK